MVYKYKKKNELPVYSWVEEKEYKSNPDLVNQVENLAKLPFLHHHVALMPDGHLGMNMPIGGVIACDKVIIPNAVGSDIGCGMKFKKRNIKVAKIKNVETGSGNLLHKITHDILRNIPVGFHKHSKKQDCKVVKRVIKENYEIKPKILKEELFDNTPLQIGTLGGGNHFIELQEDKEGYFCIMIHSGSRHLGKVINEYYNDLAKKLNKKWYSNSKIPFFPVDSEYGQEYLYWMNIALDFAKENRTKMMEEVEKIIDKNLEKYNVSTEKNSFAWNNKEIDCHHNYATIENHYGENVWVHRKGAILAREGVAGIIPGAMGKKSYIVEGLGNRETFDSCSHGAGRAMSRTKAKEKFEIQDMMEDLNEKEVILASPSKKPKLLDEYYKSYKNIEDVIKKQKGTIIKVKNEMRTVGVIKG